MRCRFCGDESDAAAGRCPACGEPAAGETEARRWWESNATVILALAVLGPFALPLVWAHPRYKRTTKIALSVMVLAFTVWAALFTRDLLQKARALLLDSF